MNWASRSSSIVRNADDATNSVLEKVDNSEPAHSNLPRRAPITREIDLCLMPCDQCTGTYEDSVNGNILRIICRHSCHSAAGEVHSGVGRKCRKSDSSEFDHPMKGYDTGSGHNRILIPILK